MDKVSYLLATQQHIHENIKFADLKAVAITAINSGIIAGLHLLDVFSKSKPEILTVAIVAFLFMATAIVLSVLVLKPRIEEIYEGVGLCDPIRIARHNERKKFIDAINSIDESSLISDVSILVFDRSVINRAKYYCLTRVVYISFIGWFISAIAVFMRIFLS